MLGLMKGISQKSASHMIKKNIEKDRGNCEKIPKSYYTVLQTTPKFVICESLRC